MLLTASGAAILAQVQGSSNTEVASFVFLLCSPLSAFAGWSLAELHYRSVVAASSELSNPYALELRVRVMVQEANAMKARARVGLGDGGGEGEEHEGAPLLLGGGGGGGGEGDPCVGAPEGYRAPSRRSEILREVDKYIEHAVSVFSSSAFVSLMYATHLGEVASNRHLESIHLTGASRKDPPIDVRWFIFKRRRELEELDMRNGQGGMNVMRRMQFEQLSGICTTLAVSSRQHIMAFWTELTENRPSHTRIQKQGMLISTALKAADMGYRVLMELASNNAVVMREYGGFLLDVANEPVRAAELLADADSLEEEQSRSHVESVSDTTFFALTTPFSDTSETAAVVRVSSDPSSIGVITHCNPVALRLFGYTKREMMGRDMSALLPEPIASVHSLFLKSFLRDGKIKVINTTRVMFGVHRAGHIFPMRGNIRPLEDGFVGVFESIPTQQSFLVFTGAASGWRLHAACAASMTALGLEPAEVRAGGYSLRAILPGIDAPGAFAALKGDGVTAPVHLKVGVRAKEDAGGAGGGGGEDAPAALGAAHALTAAAAAAAAAARADKRRVIEATAHVQDFMLPALAHGPMHVMRWTPRKPAPSLGGRAFGGGSDGGSGSGSSGSGGSDSGGSDSGSDSGGSGYGSGSGSGGSSLASSAAASASDEKAALLPPPPRAAPAAAPPAAAAAAAAPTAGTTPPPAAAPAPALASALVRRMRGGAVKVAKRVGFSAMEEYEPSPPGGGGGGGGGGLNLSTPPAAPAPFAAPPNAGGGGTPLPPQTPPPARPSAPPPPAARAAPGGGAVIRIGIAPAAAFAGAAPSPTASAALLAAAAEPAASGGSLDVDGEDGELGGGSGDAAGVRTTAGLSAAAREADAAAHEGHVLAHHSPRMGDALHAHRGGGRAHHGHHHGGGGGGGAREEGDPHGEGGGGEHHGHRGHHHGHHHRGHHHHHHHGEGGGEHHGQPPHGAFGHAGHAHDGGGPFAFSGGALALKDGGLGEGGGEGGGEEGGGAGGDRFAGGRAVKGGSPRHGGGGGGGGGGERPAKGSPRRAAKAPQPAGSVASGRSGRSSTRGGLSVATALRTVLDVGSDALEPSLVALRRALLLIFLLTAAMNFVALAIARVKFSELAHNVDTTNLHGDLGMGLQRVFTCVQVLAFASEGLYALREGDEARWRRELAASIDFFTSVHYGLYQEQGAGFSTAAEYSLYTAPSVVVTDLTPGTYVNDAKYGTSNRTVNLLNAGVEYASKARMVLALPLANLTHANVYVFWVLYNGAGMRHPHDFLFIPLSAKFADARSSDTSQVLVIVAWTVMAVALAMFSAVGLVILVRVRGVLQNKVSIFDVFLSVPSVVVRAMRTQTGLRLDAALRAATMAAEGGGMGQGENEESDAAEAVMMEEFQDIEWADFAALLKATGAAKPPPAPPPAPPAAGGGGGGAVAAPAPAASAAAVKAPGAKTPGVKAKINKRLMRHPPCGMTWRLLTPLLVPMLMMVGYYAGRTIWTMDTNVLVMQGKAEAMGAKMVEFAVAQLGFFVRDLEASCIPSRIAYYTSHMQVDLDYLQTTNDRLLYGDSSLPVSGQFGVDCPWTGCPPIVRFRSGLRTLEGVNKLFLVDGCVVTPGGYTRAQCEAFMDGSLTHGVQGLFQQLVVIVQQLMNERTALGLKVAAGTSACSSLQLRFNDKDPRIDQAQEIVETFLAVDYKYNSELYRVRPPPPSPRGGARAHPSGARGSGPCRSPAHLPSPHPPLTERTFLARALAPRTTPLLSFEHRTPRRRSSASSCPWTSSSRPCP